MKALLKDPLVLALLFVVGVIYFLIAFNYLGKNNQYTRLLEKLYICFLLVTIAGESGVTISLMNKLHPRTLLVHNVTPPTVLGQIGIYAIALLLLTPRFRYTFKDLIHGISTFIIRDPFLATFLLLMPLSVFWSDTPRITIKYVGTYLEIAFFAFYVGKQYTWTGIFQLGRWAGLFLAVTSLLMNDKDGNGAWIGIMSHKNHFCFQMLFVALLWVVYGLYNPQQRRLSFGLTFLSLFLMNMGGSGAAKVIFVCLFALWFYLGFAKKLPPQWAFISVLLFLIASICLTIVVTENLEFIVVDTLNKDLTLTGRTDFWPLIIDKINDRPLLGYGIGGFWQPWRGADDPASQVIVVATQFKPPHSHNGFMDIACDLGYLGLTLYILSFITSVAKAVMQLNQARMPEAGLPLLILSFILMTNLTETGLLGVTSVWFWYMVVAVRTSLDMSIARSQTQETVSGSQRRLLYPYR
ncbi:MAG: O-antigen ligase family protein [Jaaginema sp. PMC 1079.18]|nr:O-antigen ligase family protein [Jaaginema sp. PMC 1080.18]MEC4853938.1 O-antigen ligase family protein [Jaaginema sp. PMC 1079.18]MEC4867988.1 O-antigen ligase family protein [Jaaginema sp. PMC 1078.18]